MWLLFQAPPAGLACAPAGFSIKRSFSLNLRKAFQVRRAVAGHAAAGATASSSTQDA
jgi:hypothetical protein